MVILAMIMLIVTQVIGQAQRSWKQASARVTQFRESRAAFDTVVRGLRQATLPKYRDWVYKSGKTEPDNLLDEPTQLVERASLGFVGGPTTNLVSGGGSSDTLPGHAVIFQAPIGFSNTPSSSGALGELEYGKLKSLLNVRGYFVKFGSDTGYVPAALSSRLKQKYRYRLYEFRTPTEKNSVLDGSVTEGSWARITPDQDNAIPVAENIVALVFGMSFAAPSGGAAQSLGSPATASNSKVPFFSAYDSYKGTAAGGGGGSPDKFALPRAVQVIMVALDEESAAKLAQQYDTSPPGLLGRSGASFASTDTYDQDLKRVVKLMNSMHLNYRVFSSIVLIPAANT